ncbi:hypothetical protein MCHIJ_24690 [Mycolicibacterium chitae]|nr:hypothetical protein MCHIJ_24690 [Mycolicibacterium chitae]
MARAPSAADNAGTNSTVLVTPREASDDSAAMMLRVVSTASSEDSSVIADAAATRSPARRTSGESFDDTVEACRTAV